MIEEPEEQVPDEPGYWIAYRPGPIGGRRPHVVKVYRNEAGKLAYCLEERGFSWNGDDPKVVEVEVGGENDRWTTLLWAGREPQVPPFDARWAEMVARENRPDEVISQDALGFVYARIEAASRCGRRWLPLSQALSKLADEDRPTNGAIIEHLRDRGFRVTREYDHSGGTGLNRSWTIEW